jgi:hypothetical protein
MFLNGTHRFKFVPLLSKCFHMSFKKSHLAYRWSQRASEKSLWRASFRVISLSIIV